MLGICEAVTGAIGEELTKLFGFAATRLTSTAYPEQQIQSGINTLSWDGSLTCTLSAGSFLADVDQPMRVRVLTGPEKGKEAVIDSRDSSTQITLLAAFPFASAFTDESFEIVEDAQTTIEVETTLDFDASGRLVIDGVVYSYTSKTPTSFIGLTYDDGTGLIKDGVSKVHKSVTTVVDYTQSRSAVDRYRRGFLIDYAEGEDLSILGANLGVPRPPELVEDALYRKLIKAVAYAPRGTVFAMEQVLDALLGETVIVTGSKSASGSGDPYTVTISEGSFPADCEGLRFRVKSGYLTDKTVRIKSRTDATHIVLNLPMPDSFELESWEITEPNWELFEDLTLGSIHHGCRVFFQRKNTNGISAGKAYLDGKESRLAVVSEPDQAVYLATSSDSIDYGDAGLDSATSFVCSFDFRPSDLDGVDADHGFILGSHALNPMYHFLCHASDTGELVVYIGYDTGGYPNLVASWTSGSPVFANGVWAHVLIDFDGSRTGDDRLRITVDGTRIETSGTYSGSMPASIGNSVGNCTLRVGGPGYGGVGGYQIAVNNLTLTASGGVSHTWGFEGTTAEDGGGTPSTLTPTENGSIAYITLSSGSTDIDYTASGALRVIGITTKPDTGWVVVARGSAARSVDGGLNILGPSNEFPSRIQVGDVFQLTSGPFRGARGVIRSRVSGTQLYMGIVENIHNPAATSTGTIGTNFTASSWQIVREKTNCGLYLPSADNRPEFDGDTGTQAWEYVGTSEAAASLLKDDDHGSSLLLTPASNPAIYRRNLRIGPESDATVDISLDIDQVLSSTSTDGYQTGLVLSDGERSLAWGVIADVSGLQNFVGFINAGTGAFIGSTPKAAWSSVEDTKFSNGTNVIRIQKTGRDTVRLWRQASQGGIATSNWVLIDELAYSSFATVSAWSAAAPYTTSDYEVAWGVLDSGYTNLAWIKWVNWQTRNKKDFWNLHREGASTTAPNVVTSSDGPFISGDVGRTIRIKDFGALNAAGGNSLGVWKVDERADAQNISVIGETRYRGSFRLENRSWLVVRGESPFVWPDHRGHSIEILDGDNAGTYPIAAIIDPGTLEDVEGGPWSETVVDSLTWTSLDQQQTKVRTHIVQLDTSSLPDGLFAVGGFEVSWRFVPLFPVDSDVSFELVDVGTNTDGTLTLRESLPVTQVVDIHATKVLSAYLGTAQEPNVQTGSNPDTYSAYPFYLTDLFGYVRTVMQIVKAAGILADFTTLFVDESGRHLLESGADPVEFTPVEPMVGSAHGASTSIITLLVGSSSGASTAEGTL